MLQVLGGEVATYFVEGNDWTTEVHLGSFLPAFSLKFRDEFGNATQPSGDFKLEMEADDLSFLHLDLESGEENQSPEFAKVSVDTSSYPSE